MSGKKELEKDKTIKHTHDDVVAGNNNIHKSSTSHKSNSVSDAEELRGRGVGTREDDKQSDEGEQREDIEASTSVEDAEGDSLVLQVHTLEQENRKLKDELLRNRAELENSKKRLSKHYEELSQNKTKQLLLDIVILLDDFERAFDSMNGAENTKDTTSMIEGIKMIESQFIKTLETKWNVSRYDSLDSEFNPTFHEAMMTEVVNTYAQPTVVAEFSKGYMFNNKVLRSAKVKVAMPE